MGWTEENWWEELSTLRVEIDRLDKEILLLVKKRMEICKVVAGVKEMIGKPIFDPSREKEVIANRINIAKNFGLDIDFVKELISIFMKYSKKLQETEIRDNVY